MSSEENRTADRINRYCSARTFPRYAYVPGRHPHPVSDPEGHSFGQASRAVSPLDRTHPEQCEEFLFAVDLFNFGYYWEAHEAWESLWHAAGRTGPEATLLKGLIKLAAAGVKAREGNAAGVRRHARRAAELLRESAETAGDLFQAILGVHLMADCHALAETPIVDSTPSEAGRPVLGLRIAYR